MSEISLPVSVLFDAHPDPVLLLSEGLLRYRNPAAQTLLPGLTPDAALPEEAAILAAPGGGLVSWGGRDWLAVTRQWEQYLLIRLRRPDAASVLPNDRIPILTQKLRGPLTAWLSSEELLAGLLTPEQRQSGAMHLARSAKAQLRLLRLLRGLELASLPPNQPPYSFHPTLLDLRGLLREAYRQLTDLTGQLGCTISLQEKPGNYLVRCDEDLFLLQLYHLVSNSLRAAGTGGRLQLRLERAGQMALVTLEDNGPGLSPSDMARLFDPAQGGDTLACAGAGLGLGVTVCRKIAQLHGGSILFSNRSCGGLRVTLSLPLCSSAGELTLYSPRQVDSGSGFPLVLQTLSDVLPAECFLPEDL